MKAAFDHNYASRLDGDNVKDCKNRWDMMEQLREDIRNFKVANNCDRMLFFGLLLQRFMFLLMKKYTEHWQHWNRL